MQASDLIEISSTPQQYSLARSINSSTAGGNYSIPGLLSTLQNEWDAVMLENFELRKQLDICKKSLSDSLYKYDAVAKIAAEASMERDLLKRELANLTASISLSEEGDTVSNTENSDVKRIKLDFSLRDEFCDILKKASRQYITEFKKSKKKLAHFTEASEVSSKSVGEYNACLGNDHVKLAQRSAVLLCGDKAEIIGPVEASVELPDGVSYVVEFDGALFCIKDNTFIEIDPKSQKIVQSCPLQDNTEPIVFIGHAKHLLPSYFIVVTESGRILGVNTELKQSFLISDYTLKSPVKFVSYHKDGALLAMGNAEDGVFVVNLFEPDKYPTTFQFSFPVIQVKFALNGYWMFVQGGFQIEVIDLRRDTDAPAAEVIKTDRQITTFEIDDTGKGLLLCFEGDHISWYEYAKGRGFKETTKFESKNQNVEAVLLTSVGTQYVMKAIAADRITTYALQ